MEQSDQKSVIESGGAAVPPPEQPSANAGSAPAEDSKPKHDRSQKRKRGGGQSGQKNDRRRSDKGGDMGRREYFRNNPDKRHRNDMNNAKRQKREEEGAPEPSYFNFSKEEIEAEERKPKRKVAILVGYSGTGYKGMQISPTEKTIEGDLFMAFIKAGAISKANANDPKKSGLVRCARTDKGVHAAGNVINLKLIIEDPDIKQKINDQLSSQIRIWQIQRTTGSFSCYQACDSRWYEYLIPSHSFLPPHPSTFLSKKLIEHATEVGDLEEHQKRQHEVAGWWEAAEEKYIKPILDGLDEIIKPHVMQAMYISDGFPTQDDRETEVTTDGAPTGQNAEITDTSDKTTEGAPLPEDPQERKEFRKAIDAVVKELRQAYWTAKESYRIPPERLERVKEALNLYCGTKNFHNFTIRKSATDPSAKRHIKSFVVSGDPIIINGVEWVSLKVHGQSFMMHQIRKMVGLVALVVRCGCPTSRVSEALDKNALNIPKAPGLGLLLERPVFDHYNTKADNFGREKIEFELVEEEMNAFKQKEIYDRIFREEMEGHTFHAFFSHVDNFKQNIFLYLTSKGMEAATVPQGQRRHLAKEEAELVDSDDDEEAPKVGEGAEG